MKLTSFLLCSCLAFAPSALLAQTKAPAKPHTAAPRVSKTGCAKLPEISPKLPALPADASCFKSLFTIHQTQPGIKADYVSPLEPSDLLESLGLDLSYSLAYVDIKQGTGPLAESHKWYTVKYAGYLASDGTKFDSSDDHPAFVFQQGTATAQPRPVIGFDTGFAGMHIGGKRRIFIPWQIGYRNQGNPPKIPPAANLVFDVELVSQSAEAPPGAAPATPPAAARPMPAPAPAPPAATAPKPQ